MGHSVVPGKLVDGLCVALSADVARVSTFVTTLGAGAGTVLHDVAHLEIHKLLYQTVVGQGYILCILAQR